MTEFYYVIDDITGEPEMAQLIAIENGYAILQSVSNNMQYCRQFDDIYSDLSTAAQHCTSRIAYEYEYEYEYEYGPASVLATGEYVEF